MPFNRPASGVSLGRFLLDDGVTEEDLIERSMRREGMDRSASRAAQARQAPLVGEAKRSLAQAVGEAPGKFLGGMDQGQKLAQGHRDALRDERRLVDDFTDKETEQYAPLSPRAQAYLQRIGYGTAPTRLNRGPAPTADFGLREMDAPSVGATIPPPPDDFEMTRPGPLPQRVPAVAPRPQPPQPIPQPPARAQPPMGMSMPARSLPPPPRPPQMPQVQPAPQQQAKAPPGWHPPMALPPEPAQVAETPPGWHPPMALPPQRFGTMPPNWHPPMPLPEDVPNYATEEEAREAALKKKSTPVAPEGNQHDMTTLEGRTAYFRGSEARPNLKALPKQRWEGGDGPARARPGDAGFVGPPEAGKEPPNPNAPVESMDFFKGDDADIIQEIEAAAAAAERAEEQARFAEVERAPVGVDADVKKRIGRFYAQNGSRPMANPDEYLDRELTGRGLPNMIRAMRTKQLMDEMKVREATVNLHNQQYGAPLSEKDQLDAAAKAQENKARQDFEREKWEMEQSGWEFTNQLTEDGYPFFVNKRGEGKAGTTRLKERPVAASVSKPAPFQKGEPTDDGRATYFDPNTGKTHVTDQHVQRKDRLTPTERTKLNKEAKGLPQVVQATDREIAFWQETLRRVRAYNQGKWNPGTGWWGRTSQALDLPSEGRRDLTRRFAIKSFENLMNAAQGLSRTVDTEVDRQRYERTQPNVDMDDKVLEDAILEKIEALVGAKYKFGEAAKTAQSMLTDADNYMYPGRTQQVGSDEQQKREAIERIKAENARKRALLNQK